jgi:hypothetical protein
MSEQLPIATAPLPAELEENVRRRARADAVQYAEINEGPSRALVPEGDGSQNLVSSRNMLFPLALDTFWCAGEFHCFQGIYVTTLCKRSHSVMPSPMSASFELLEHFASRPSV